MTTMMMMESLEVEETLAAKTTKPPPRQEKEPPWMVVARYFALATVALVLAGTVPRAPEGLTLARVRIAALYTITLVLFVRLHRSDPGFITADHLLQLEDGLSLLGSQETELHDSNAFSNGQQSNPSQPATLDEENGGLTRRGDPPFQLTIDKFDASLKEEEEEETFRGTRRKFCDICQFAPPLRSHHCKQCRKCVATFDHHCNLVGNCIGERNRGLFWWFLLSQTTGFIFMVDMVGSSNLGWTSALRNGDLDSWRVVISKIYLYPLCWISVVMFLLHSFFGLTNLTTFECSKGSRHIDYLRGTRDMDLPFSKGFFKNISDFCQFRRTWTPKMWSAPGKIVRDSEDWWEHPWQNKYWSCC